MERFKVHKNQVLLLLAAAQFMIVLDSSIVNMALPAVSEALKFKASELQWIVTAYTLGFGGFLLLGGRAADLFGRRRMFMLGIIAFTLASFVAGFSNSSNMLIIMRAVQGMAAAFMSPAALSIVLNTFKEGKERNKALGVWGGVAAGGAAAGVLLGGVLTEYAGWRWDFFVNVPVGLLIAFLVPRVVPESKSNLDHKHLDLSGATFITAGLMLLVFGLTKAPDYGWTDSRTLLTLAGSAILIASFIFNEYRSKHPLVPLGIFKLRNLTAANLTQLPITAALFSMFFFLSLYVQNVLGYSPVHAGLSFLPVTFVIGFASAIGSNLVSKIGYKPPMVIAPIFMAIGLILFSQMPVDGNYWTDVLPGLVFMSLGAGFTFVTITIAATSGVRPDQSGLASGILNTAQQIGGALGLAILSGISAAAAKEAVQSGTTDVAAVSVAGFHDAFLVGAGFAAFASLVALVLVKQRRGEPADEQAVVMAH